MNQENSKQVSVMKLLNELQIVHPNSISFASGRPDASFFSDVDFNQYIETYLQYRRDHKSKSYPTSQGELLQYHSSSGIISDLLALYLELDENIKIDPSCVLVANGAQEAFLLCALAIAKPGTSYEIVFEDPGYPGHHNVADILNIPSHFVPVKQDGMDLEYLEILLKKRDKKIKLIFTQPDFHNPTGNSMSVEKRMKLLELSETYDFLILEDNPYGIFNYHNNTYPTLKSLDTKGRVIYVGSFSKTLFPGLRIAVVVADYQDSDSHLSDRISSIKGYNTVITSGVCQAILGGILIEKRYSLKEYNKAKRDFMKEKQRYLLEILDRDFDDLKSIYGVEWNQPDGGFFIVIKLPVTIGISDMNECVERFQVIFMPMNLFYSNKSKENNSIRLAFSNLQLIDINKGLKQLKLFIMYKLDSIKQSSISKT